LSQTQLVQKFGQTFQEALLKETVLLVGTVTGDDPQTKHPEASKRTVNKTDI
jgi:hypothetical protein